MATMSGGMIGPFTRCKGRPRTKRRNVHKWTCDSADADYYRGASVGFASVPKHKRPQLITLPKLRPLAFAIPSSL